MVDLCWVEGFQLLSLSKIAGHQDVEPTPHRMIIPGRTWIRGDFITMVIVSPLRIGLDWTPLPYMAMNSWLLNGSDPITTYPSVLGDDPPSAWYPTVMGLPSSLAP